jgi:hypothetical protein
MGMDPVQQTEVYEVTVQLEGPVGETAFDDFQKAVTTFIHQARKIQDKDHLDANGHPQKLSVREVRSGVRATGP